MHGTSDRIGSGYPPAGTVYANDYTLVVPGPASRWSLNVTLNWNSIEPTTERLGLTAAVYRSCGDNCVAWLDRIDIEGASPIRLQGVVEDLEGRAEGLLFNIDARLRAGFASTHLAQEFYLNGTIS